MGVLGITPFLQKICPEVIKRLPDRLKSLRGKTIVIDGTLITQRLHFAPMPHPHRHVLGWHRILTELKECDVRAICVFDGKQRNAAKAREVERRRETRKIDAARGSIEAYRLHRLQRLMCLLPHYRSLRTPDRQRVDEALEKVRSANRPISVHSLGSTAPTPTSTPAETSIPPSSCATSTPHRSYPLGRHPYFFAHGGMGVDELQEVVTSVSISQATPRSDPCQLAPGVAELPPLPEQAVPIESTDKGVGSVSLSDDRADDPFAALPTVYWSGVVQPPSVPWFPDHPLPVIPAEPVLPESVESFESEFSALYGEYKQCLAQLSSMPSSFDGPAVSDESSAAGVADAAEARIECAMSKQQLQMTLDEGRIWDSLVASSPDVPSPPIDTESTLSALAEKSNAISESYQRRSNPPTAETYEASKEILRAMGVPCIESTGPFEAEALASSLVIHGHADYVASEDTDVLVYEAPMIRNITTREAPIVVVRGEEIRTTLQLDRASYIDFALLLGTDFSQRIKNVGPSRALKFIREHGSIERVIEQESKYPPRVPVPDYLEQVGVARLVFQTLPPVPDPEVLQQMEGDPKAVSEVIQKYDLNRVLCNSWDYHASLAGNYFGDNPSAW
ncbi:PIN domain-like protein [Gyrodon lividus]|nr:PIN domain-like protein [Gyrodon lividus]